MGKPGRHSTMVPCFKHLFDKQQSTRLDMLNYELAQMFYNYLELGEIIDNDEVEYEKVGYKSVNILKML